jgi:signal transduction histidine kinase
MKHQEEQPEMDFYDTVVCELRQPLTSITAEVQLAKRLLKTDPSRAGEALDLVVQYITRIDRLLVELRDRARDAAHMEALFRK